MLAVVTRVQNASVEVGGSVAGSIGKGFLVLLGVGLDDTPEDAQYMADRICGLRVFEDSSGKMNLSPRDTGAQLLLVSQFTLFGDVSQRRPSFAGAARPEQAAELYEAVITLCRREGFVVESGIFGAEMQVFSQNDGPVTLLIDSRAARTKKTAEGLR